jgi:riboflavin kinase/FMN adenylyltransferase
MKRLIAIGNFDGVHLGHQHLLETVLAQAHQRQLQPMVLTFDPHPSVVLGRPSLPLLTRVETKVKLLRSLEEGLEVAVHPFTRELSSLSPEAFVRDILVGQYDAGHVVVGANFRFGAGRAGNLETLQWLGEQLGFSAEAMPLLHQGNAPISSSRIRAALGAGQVAEAASMLGRPHTTLGEVVHGDALGRQLGFPTANLANIVEMVPGFGIYACRVHISGEPSSSGVMGAASIGIRPTVDQSGPPEVRVEVHLLDVQADLYGKQLVVEWVRWLRGEEKFASLDALKEQIQRDVAHARAILS